MHLQGNLQKVFDALYNMGVIDPVLKKDWCQAFDEIPTHRIRLDQAVLVVNNYQHDTEKMVYELGKFEEKILEFLAIEVAREFAEFQTRTSLQ